MIAVQVEVFDFRGINDVDTVNGVKGAVSPVKRLCDFDVCPGNWYDGSKPENYRILHEASGCANSGNQIGYTEPGLVKTNLVNGVPVQNILGKNARNIGKWYTEDLTYNKKVKKFFNLDQKKFTNVDGEEVIPNFPLYFISFNKGYFFPLTRNEGVGYPSGDGDYTDDMSNHLFSTVYRNNFTYHKLKDSKTGANLDMTLSFYTDDDSWVFIDQTLAYDNGGLTGPSEFHFTLDTVRDRNGKLLEEGKVYEIAVFQADRCPTQASMSLYATVLDASSCVTPDGDNDHDKDGIVDCLDACPYNKDRKAPGDCGCSSENCKDTVCNAFNNEAVCLSNSTGCEWCGDGIKGGSCVKVGECSCSMISQETKCSVAYASKCSFCALSGLCVTKNTCPCDSIGPNKDLCVANTKCNYCGWNCTYAGQCPPCKDIKLESQCYLSEEKCDWCGNITAPGKTPCAKKNECPSCNYFAGDKINCDSVNKTKNCNYCVDGGNCISGTCTPCSQAKNKDECSQATGSNCQWCGTTCIAQSSTCPTCDESTFDTCELQTGGGTTLICDWCGNGKCSSKGACPDCDSFNSPLTGLDYNNPTAVYDAETKTRNDCLGSTKKCYFCGRGLQSSTLCTASPTGCPTCNTYKANPKVCKKLENSTSVLPYNFACDYCEYTELCMTKTPGKTSVANCDVDCHLYVSPIGCQASNHSCHWCVGMNSTLDIPCRNSTEFCPDCPNFLTSSTCSAAGCNWCQPQSGGSYSCVGNTCPIPAVVIAVAAIAGAVIAAIIIAIIVFLLLSSFASKKLYDAIKSAKEAEMTSATESGLYVQNDVGGENPLHK